MKAVIGSVATLVALLVPLTARATHVTPTAITFKILHADCAGQGVAQFRLFLNDTQIGSVPSSQDCICNANPLQVTFTDAPTLALFDPAGCNRLRVDIVGGDVFLGSVRVDVSPASESACLFDGFSGNTSTNCAPRDLCSFPNFTNGLTSVGATDADGDGVPSGIGHGCDDCPNTPNPDQADGDGDGFGDACDSCVGAGTADDDGDTLCNDGDNCRFVPNLDQANGDGDDFGDACDFCVGPGAFDDDGDTLCNDADNCRFNANLDQTDGDADDVGDACDNCPAVPNTDQSDANFNGIGDVCDPCGTQFDSDFDGVCIDDNCPFSFNPNQADGDADDVGDVCDNCPSQANADQADSDFDGIGNACDFCVGPGAGDGDGDGRCDLADNCPTVANPGQQDRDFDSIGDACDPCVGFGSTDTDADGFCDFSGDNCPTTANPGQEDTDGDAVGDACDGCVGQGAADADADGICDLADNCVTVPNPGQEDRDSNGRGDVCDCGGFGSLDIDGDSFCDSSDNCPTVFNPGQENSDTDGVGDACDPCPAQVGLGGADADGDGRPNSCDACPADANDRCGTILGCTGSGETDIQRSALVRINPSTGTASFIGSTGIRGCTGLAFKPGTGTLFAVGRDTSSSFALWTVDTSSGHATQVAPIVSSAFGAFTSDVAFRDDGTLFAFGAGSSRLSRLGLDGRMTDVGFSAFIPPGGGLAFRQGTLLLATAALNTVDPVTGAATIVAPLGAAATGCVNPSMVGLASDPAGPLLGVLACSPSFSVAYRLLVAINPLTGAVTSRGVTAPGLSAIAVAPPCGDGIVQLGEACDGGPCCSPACTFLPRGATCPDEGDLCTADSCDGAGTCRHEFPTHTACHDALPGGARFSVKYGDEPRRHAVSLSWRSNSDVTLGQFGDPTSATDIGLCVADGSGRLVLSATAPRGSTCGSRPCWGLRRDGLRYRNSDATPDGLVKAQLRAGEAGRARITFKGKGGHLDPMAPPWVGPVKVRVVRGDSPVCFEAGFFSPTHNDEQRYKAEN